MITPNKANTPESARAYEPPALVVLGSVEAITLSSRSGSFSDMKGRTNKHP